MSDDEVYTFNKILYHLDRLDKLKNGKPIMPLMIELHLEAYCNDNCDFCGFREENGTNLEMLKLINGESSEENKPIGRPSDKSKIPFDVVMSLPKIMKENNIPACIMSGGGEPTIYPKFDEILDEFITNGIEIGLITNGSGLNEIRIDKIVKNCTWIRISMDSADAETHKKIHRTPNSDFERRLKLLNMLIEKKKEYGTDIVIGVSYIITNDNYGAIDKAVELYKDVDSLRFSFANDMGGIEANNVVQEQSIAKVKKYQETDPNISLSVITQSDCVDMNDFDKCHIQHFNWVIGADAILYPCCVMAYHPNFAMADLRKVNLNDIVNNKIVHDQMFNLDPKGCMPCWLRSKNKAIDNIYKEPLHKNFY